MPVAFKATTKSRGAPVPASRPTPKAPSRTPAGAGPTTQPAKRVTTKPTGPTTLPAKAPACATVGKKGPAVATVAKLAPVGGQAAKKPPTKPSAPLPAVPFQPQGRVVHVYWSERDGREATTCPACKQAAVEHVTYTNMMFGAVANCRCTACSVAWELRIAEEPDW